MAVSRRSALAACGIAAGAVLLATVAMAPPMAGAGAAASGAAVECRATARVDAQWGAGAGGGQIITVTMVNTSAVATTGWAVTWTIGGDQRVVAAWNASVGTAGTRLTAVNTPHNGVLTPGASTSFGMQLSGVAAAPVPSCSGDSPAPTTSGSPSTTPPGGADVTLTAADSQRTVTLLVGQTLGVALSANYVPILASGDAVAQVSTSGGYPSGQPLAALYRAVAPGSVELTSHTDHACLHTSPPCALPIFLWTVRVDVVSVPPTGGTVTVTAADNQKTVGLRVGEILVVSLPREYQPPTVAPSGVLGLADTTGGYPTNQPLLARYVAVAPGQADVSTLTDAACIHAPTPCPSPQIPWKVRVTVAA